MRLLGELISSPFLSVVLTIRNKSDSEYGFWRNRCPPSRIVCQSDFSSLYPLVKQNLDTLLTHFFAPSTDSPVPDLCALSPVFNSAPRKATIRKTVFGLGKK
jgi:hypothetical protein